MIPAWRGKNFWAKAVKAKPTKRKPRSVGLKPPVAPDHPLRNSDGLVLAGNHGRRNPIDERTLEMDELHKEGCSYRELARRYSLSHERVSQLIRQLHRKQREDKATHRHTEHEGGSDNAQGVTYLARQRRPSYSHRIASLVAGHD